MNHIYVQTIEMAFYPQADISAYELALCMTMLITALARNARAVDVCKQWDELPHEAKRHFQPRKLWEEK